MKWSAIILAAALVAPATLAAQEAQGYEAPRADIVQTAVAAGSFTTLAKAIAAAGLVETLEGEGPFTVFAPTDEAFAKLPAGALDALLADKTKLTKVLTYHVVPGKVGSSDIAALTSATTVNGKALAIASTGGQVTVGGARVTQADIAASNGVIHVIDSVLLPE
jgi:uncharacterized surface protein with fasciclin (FAS1) repeats